MFLIYMNSLANRIVNNIGKKVDTASQMGKKTNIDEHNRQLEQARLKREGDNKPISEEEGKAWADYQLNDPDIKAQREAEDEERWASQRQAKRQAYLDQESGVNKFFRKVNNGLIKVADVASNIVSNPIGDLYSYVAPRGSIYNNAS